MGQKVKTSPPPWNFRDPPGFLPEGVLYSFPGVVKHINAANMQKYNFLYKPHADNDIGLILKSSIIMQILHI